MDEADACLERLLAEWQDRIYAFSLALCGNRWDAEEIAQDCFLRAHRALAGYEASRIEALQVRPWLHRIALNVFRNRHRRRRLPEAAWEGLDAASDAEGPEARAVRADAGRRLRSLLAELPGPQREAVVLRHVEDLSYAEAAEVLGQPEGTVKSNVHRGLARLRRRLAEMEVSGVG